VPVFDLAVRSLWANVLLVAVVRAVVRGVTGGPAAAFSSDPVVAAAGEMVAVLGLTWLVVRPRLLGPAPMSRPRSMPAIEPPGDEAEELEDRPRSP